MRRPDSGIVLVSVLALLGLAAATLHLMLGPGEAALARSQRFGEAGQALALLRAGEQSALTALRRDMVEAPELDHRGEAWSAVEQAEMEIAGGRFALEIADARARVNLNALDAAAPDDLRLLLALCAAAGLGAERAGAIAGVLEAKGPLGSLDELAAAGLDPGEISALARLADALPGRGAVNINAAPVEVIAAILRDPARARALVSRRERAGFLRPEDVEAMGMALPPALGWGSDLFRVVLRVRVGGTAQFGESLLHRRDGGGGPEVSVVRRRLGAAIAAPPPPP